MAMQPSQPSQDLSRQRPYLRPVTDLSGKRSFTFGRFLATLREDAGLTQEVLVEVLPEYFKKAGNVPVIDLPMYGNLERGRRYPAFAELELLYWALVEGCQIILSAEERDLYVTLARKKIEQKKKRR